MEWLKHSSKLTKQCDICNTPYQFKTIYDPNMPKRVPLLLIVEKVVSTVTKAITKYLLIVLYLAFILQLPIFWKLIGRVYTFVVDGTLPPSSHSVAMSLLYGTSIAFQEDVPSEANATMFEKAWFIFINTFQSGLFHVAMFVVMLVSIFVEHEWVVRDEGYMKILLNEIGVEPRSKLLELLEGLQRRDRGEDDDNNAADRPGRNRAVDVELLGEAIRDLQNFPGGFPAEADLRRALQTGQLNDVMRRDLLPGQRNERQNEEQEEAPLVLPDMPANHFEMMANAGDNVDIEAAHQNVGNAANENINASDDDPQDEDYVYDGDDNNDSNLETDDEHIDLHEDHEDDNQDAMAALDPQPVEDLDEGILEIIGLKLNVSTPLLLMVLVDLIVMIFLFVAYLIPHMVGNFVLYIIALTYQYVVQKLITFNFLNVVPGYVCTAAYVIMHYYSKAGLLLGPLNFLKHVFFQPVLDVVTRCLSLEKVFPVSLTERVIALFIGYLLGCYAVYSAMRAMTAGKKPIVGTTRRVYKVLFEITATLKVFVVFAVEIVVFPVYCGWLIDMCLTPLFKSELTTTNADGSIVYQYLFIASTEPYNSPSARIIIYWGFGTIYMLCFALYVGMLRNKILRPGVLFFIRSPEDPNARLIHDALVKSLRFQLLRIWLSAKFYTGNILLGIGIITWGLRWFTTTLHPEKNVLLPIPISVEGILHVAAVARIARENHTLLASWCASFWQRVFDVVCYKLRLSDFILCKSVAEERGYVVYKSWFHEIRGDQPDWEHPLSLAEARLKLKEPGVTACFVPNGYYVRAPSSDTSRKFIDQLFIPVTSTDQPLKEPENKPTRNEDGYESDYSDVDLNYENSYDIVYRPPDFKTRCMLLVILLGVFAQLLFVLLGTTAALTGRLLVNIFAVCLDFTGLKWHPYQIDHSKADLQSISFGLSILMELFAVWNNEELVQPREAVRNAIPAQINVNVDVRNWISPWHMIPLVSRLVLLIHIGGQAEYIERRLFGTTLLESQAAASYINLIFNLVIVVIAGAPWAVPGLEEMMDLSLFHRIWKWGVIDDLVIHGFVFWIKSRGAADIVVAYWSLTAFAIIKACLGGLRWLELVNDQVKKEKYVRGTAVQSLDEEATG